MSSPPPGSWSAPDVPVLVRRRAALLGASGRAWLAGLEDTLAELERRWSFTVRHPLAGGSAAAVYSVRLVEGTAVLKVPLPDDDGAEARLLERASGRGYVRLLRRDARSGAVLLEALGASLADEREPPDTQALVLADLLQRAWLRPDPSQASPAAVAWKAESLAAFVREAGADAPRRVLETALRCADARVAAADPARAVVVHGDPHAGNALRAPEGGYRFIDPDGFVCEPEYDLGVLVRERGVHDGASAEEVGTLCRLLAGRTGLDERAVREWAALERVTTGLLYRRLGEHEQAERWLSAAARSPW